MKKIFLILSIFLFLIFFSNALLKLAFADTLENEEDIQSSYIMECLVPPEDFGDKKNLFGRDGTTGFHGRPPEESTIYLNGQCSSPAGCDLTLCVINQFENLTRGDINAADEETEIGQAKSRIYIEPGEEKCTTGNSEKDLYYFGQDYTSVTETTLTAPNLIDNHIPSGKIENLLAILKNPEGHSFYSFYAIGGTGTIFPTTAVDEGLDPTLLSNRTQQLGTAKGSSQPISITLAPGERADCETVYWDPYGRVFDGFSLEPLNKDEAKVTLLNKDDSIVAIPNNNVSIDILGKYNILINKDGEYKLKVTPLTAHQFINFIPDPRYKDLYESIFMPGDQAFFESVKEPKRVDVSLKPVSNPYNRLIDIVQNDYKQVWANGKKYIKIEIRVTHPKSIVKLIVNDIVIKENGEGTPLPTTTDKNGYWKIMVRDFKVLSQKGFRIEISKNPQYYMFAGSIGNKLIIDFDPILSYVEGYAYDEKGMSIPNAKVQIKLKMNDSIFYETKADDKGFFTVNPAKLPPLDFYFVFINPQNSQSTKKTTTDFVNENNAYLENEKINLLKAERNGTLVIKNINSTRGFSLDDVVQENNLEEKSDSKTIKNNYSLILGFIALIILIIGAGATVLYIFLKKPEVTS